MADSVARIDENAFAQVNHVGSIWAGALQRFAGRTSECGTVDHPRCPVQKTCPQRKPPTPGGGRAGRDKALRQGEVITNPEPLHSGGECRTCTKVFERGSFDTCRRDLSKCTSATTAASVALASLLLAPTSNRSPS